MVAQHAEGQRGFFGGDGDDTILIYGGSRLNVDVNGGAGDDTCTYAEDQDCSCEDCVLHSDYGDYSYSYDLRRQLLS